MPFGIEFSPWLYGALLAVAVGLGLPAGVLVVSAGSLYGPGWGVLLVLIAESLGLAFNWRLCRGLLRPRLEAWLQRRPQGRLLQRLLQQQASLRLLVLLRLALLPMNVVNASCALSPTPLRRYAIASLALVPRFAVMVLAGAIGAEAVKGVLGPWTLALRGLAVLATAAVLWCMGEGLRRSLKAIPGETGPSGRRVV
jgi:uncharacterized membrane protein YdjX (TVP38/TMEM64 family)